MDSRKLTMTIINSIGYFVIGLFFVFAAFLVFSDYFTYLPLNFRIIFAFLLVGYAAFRIVSVINKRKKENDEE
jgi:hypothetical protein